MKIPSDRFIVGKNEKRWVPWKSIKRHLSSSQTTPIIVFGSVGSNLFWKPWRFRPRNLERCY